MFSFPQFGNAGAIPNYADILKAFLLANIQYSPFVSAGVTDTLTASQIVGGVLVRSGGTTATVTTDTATNIINALGPNATVGQTFMFMYTNLNSGTSTISGGTGVTVVGTATVLTAAMRVFVGTVANVTAGAQAVTFQSAFSVGSGLIA